MISYIVCDVFEKSSNHKHFFTVVILKVASFDAPYTVANEQTVCVRINVQVLKIRLQNWYQFQSLTWIHIHRWLYRNIDDLFHWIWPNYC